MALIRFVNSLLDPLQKRDKNIPLGILAADVDLPTAFVEIRHWGTHESNLPATEILRDMGIRALEWLWQNYWNRKEDSVGVIALWKSGSMDIKGVISAFEKKQGEMFERLLVLCAEDDDFAASQILWAPLISSLSEGLSDFPESFVEYVVQTLTTIPHCDAPL